MRVECIRTAVCLLMPFAVTNGADRKGGIAPTRARSDRTMVHTVLSFRRWVAAGMVSLFTTSLVRYTAAAAIASKNRRNSPLHAAVATTTSSSRDVLLRNLVDPTRAAVAIALAACNRCGLRVEDPRMANAAVHCGRRLRTVRLVEVELRGAAVEVLL